MQVTTTNYRKKLGWSTPLPDVNSPQTLVLVFGAAAFFDFHSPFLELKNKYPNSVIAGCSTAGEIFNDLLFDHSLVVSIIRFKHTNIRLCTIPITSMDNSLRTGEEVAESLNHSELSAIFVLTDGLLVNGTDFVKGVNKKLHKNVVVTGGLAGDGNKFQHTWILVDGLPRSGAVSGIGFYGKQVRVDYGSKGGWKAFGPDRVVNKSKNNVLYELDDEPALALYKGYLGDMAEGLPATGLRYPLSLVDNISGKKLVRTILGVNEEDQSLIFAGDITEGQSARLMYATFDNLIDGAEQAVSMITINADSNQDVLAIAISCVGRRMVMAEEPGAELEATLEFLPKQTKQIGFYSYGELSPSIKNDTCDLHNQTMTLTTIYEQ